MEILDEIGEGPLFNRSCTDVLCLLIFLIFCGGTFAIAEYGFSKGNPSELLAPLDADGKFCGLGD
jgi:choline transporter-like protein 2/4/5